MYLCLVCVWVQGGGLTAWMKKMPWPDGFRTLCCGFLGEGRGQAVCETASFMKLETFHISLTVDGLGGKERDPGDPLSCPRRYLQGHIHWPWRSKQCPPKKWWSLTSRPLYACALSAHQMICCRHFVQPEPWALWARWWCSGSYRAGGEWRFWWMTWLHHHQTGRCPLRWAGWLWCGPWLTLWSGKDHCNRK